MNKNKPTKSRSGIQLFAVLFITFNITSLASFSVYSATFESGELSGSLDTTVSMGSSSRVQRKDADNIGIANGGTAFSTNNDNGNLNHSRGVYSTLTKFTTELDVNYKNFGLFFRGNGFKDFSSRSTDRTALTEKADRLVSHNINLQDLYAWADFDIGNMPLQVRVGEQVISWGESTFIQNSINTINPVDVTKLRTPGSELKDALTPVGIAWASLGITDNLSVEGYYQYDYERIITDPDGSYFSTNDLAGPASNKLFLGFGDVSDLGTIIPGPTSIAASTTAALAATSALYAAGGSDGLNTTFDSAPRSLDVRPGNGGEFGVAMRLFAPKLNDTEFGLFFVNYHSRLPIISARAPTAAGIGNSGVAAISSTCNAAAIATIAGSPTAAALTAGCESVLPAGSVAGIVGAAVGGGPSASPLDTAPIVAATIAGSAIPAAFGADAGAGAAADGANCATLAALNPTSLTGFTGFTGSAAQFGLQCGLTPAINTANYFVEYPEDIQLLGLSFNTQLGASGVALQGEYSFRHDVPLQIDVQELLLAAGTALNNNPVLAASATVAGTIANNQITGGAILAPGTLIPGFILRNVSQVQMTATKVFGPTMSANTAVLVGEVAVTHIHAMPDKDVLRLESPGTHTTGNPFHAGASGFHAGKAAELDEDFADATSWGYQVRGGLQYLNAIGPVNVLPRFAWRHDVSGISPGPGGNFLEDRKALSLGVGFTYQNDWRADLSYTNFFGAGRHNPLRDRDFASFSISYSF
jgi:Protein of unknown function (DUF1302)